VDYRLYHAVNVLARHHHWLERTFNVAESWGVPLIGASAFALWLLARPRGDRKWKLAASSSLAAAALGLVVNQLIAAVWHRDRPYETHPLVYHPHAHSHDPSFPSDHASAAFAIAFAVLFFDRLLGTIFLSVAVLIGIGRVFIGAHYPLDIVAGCLVGLGSAVIVVRLARPVIAFLVRLVERVTDPVLAPLWRRGVRAS
jgi:undecaprenyl-diphosphatase